MNHDHHDRGNLQDVGQRDCWSDSSAIKKRHLRQPWVGLAALVSLEYYEDLPCVHLPEKAVQVIS